jgi:hypothetical protein
MTIVYLSEFRSSKKEPTHLERFEQIATDLQGRNLPPAELHRVRYALARIEDALNEHLGPKSVDLALAYLTEVLR